MTGDKVIYPYTSPDAPGQKINYSYSAFRGEAFIDAWKIRRNDDVSEDFMALNGSEPNLSGTPTEGVFLHWIAAMRGEGDVNWEALNLLLKRFEVTKKIYEDYGLDFRPIDKQSLNNFRLYVIFTQVLTNAFETTKKLPYLNALLKANDIGQSVSGQLNEEEKMMLGYSIQKEREFIMELRTQLS